MDNWRYMERQVVTDPKGRQWSVALFDMLGQEGDPEMPSEWLQLQFASGRYFAIIYSGSGAIQWERGYASLTEATDVYRRLIAAVSEGTLDPGQPVFRQNLED